MASDNYSKNTFYSICGFGIVTISNFAFIAIAGRLMGPAYFCVFTAFFYFLIGISWANSSLQLASAKYVTLNDIKTTAGAVKILSLDFWLAGLVMFCFIFALHPFFRIVYGLQSPWESAAGALIASLLLIIAGYRGIYQGQMDFLRLSINQSLEIVVRTIAGFVFIIAGWKISGALGASVAGSAAAIILLTSACGWAFFGKRELKINWGLLGTYFKTCLILVPFGMIYALDQALVNYLREEQRSSISVCAQFGKNLVTLSLFFSNVVYAYSLKNRKKSHFWTGLILTVIAFFSASLLTVFFGKIIIGILLGQAYINAAAMLPFYILACLPLGILLNILNYSIARNIKNVSWVIWLILALLTGIYYYTLKNFSMDIFLTVMGGSVAAADIGLLFLVFSNGNLESGEA
ncbi:MAG: hypothetical protein ABSG94_04285 [Brevinematales bacterium]